MESGRCWCPVSKTLLPHTSILLSLLTFCGYRYLNIFYSTWGLLLGGLVFALPMMHMRILDHTTDVVDDEASDTWDD